MTIERDFTLQISTRCHFGAVFFLNSVVGIEQPLCEDHHVRNKPPGRMVEETGPVESI
jgi:hypothetical protein